MTDAKTLPFTAANEQKKVDAEVLPTIQTL
jgi:hypothetical protein